MSSTLNISSWNLNGIKGNILRREHLVSDAIRYHLDVVCLQETKCRDFEETIIDGHKLVTLAQSDNWYHYGLGFLICPALVPSIVAWRSLSNRVAFIDIRLIERNGSHRMIRIVNVYGPTKKIVDDDISRVTGNSPLLQSYFNDLKTAINIPARYDLFVAGDFNARLGRCSRREYDAGLNNHIGQFGNGLRNRNGEFLLDFIVDNGLFACNTAFQHRAKYITTWKARCVPKGRPKGSKDTVNYFKQIDYILCRTNFKVCLTDSRSFCGDFVKSDHKPVVARFKLGCNYIVHKRPRSEKIRFDVNRLNDSDIKSKFFDSFKSNIDCRVLTKNAITENSDIFGILSKCAVQVVGKVPPRKPHQYSDDPTVAKLSAERKSLQQECSLTGISDRSDLRKRINHLKRTIKKRLKSINEATANALVDVINNTDSCRSMFEANRTLAQCRMKKDGVTVHDADGNTLGSDSLKAEAIKEYFNNEFNDKDEPHLPAFIDPPGSLLCPITPEEVGRAVMKLKSGRACGPDGIPNELMKAAGYPLHYELARIYNLSFETNTYIPAIGEGILTPLQKPGKPRGPVKSIRPLTLLNGTRKVLSLVALNRINYHVDMYTGPWQAAYKQGRSCADLVWSQRMLTSVVTRREFEYSKINIDMTAAFNTIRRQTIINLLIDAGCSRDDIRLVQYLLSNTKLKVTVNRAESGEFVINIGAYQGDSLAGKVFTLTLAGALNHIRAVISVTIPRPNPPVSDRGLPLESAYADDAELLSEDGQSLVKILEIASDILKDWSLFVNESKTVFTRVYLAETDALDAHGNKIRGDEEWRESVLLGSKLCSERDIINRRNKANVAFYTYKKVWLNSSVQISESRKLKLYEALVTSVLLYNCSSWAAPETVMASVDVLQRKHLRQIINTYWPTVISNENLYKRCNVRPLTERIKKARWKMLGHVLRSGDDTPAFLSFRFACLGCLDYKGRRGRPRSNLFDLLLKDIMTKNIIVIVNKRFSLSNFNDLVYKAHDRRLWRSYG